MRPSLYGVVTILVVAIASAAFGQTMPVSKSPPQPTSQAGLAMQQAAAAGKYLFVFFWKIQDAQTDQVWQTLQEATGKMANRVMVASVSVNDPAEKPIIDQYGVARAPMPLVLSLAPCGAVTKAFRGRFDANQLQTAFVSPCTERCMKALQDRKLVFLCVQRSATPVSLAAIQGVRQFQADPRYAAYTEVVQLNSSEPAEASFMKDLQIDPRSPNPVTVFLAPPGSVIGRFEGVVTKDQLVAKLQSAQSGGCPGGKCGPGGCGPKK